MGMDFQGHGDASSSLQTWVAVYNVALAFGWKPAGTVAPEMFPGPGRWDGTYFTSDFQKVRDDDAIALAAALRRALAALEARKRLTKKQTEAWGNKTITIAAVLKFAELAEKGHFAIL
jgi:hypothetical protein